MKVITKTYREYKSRETGENVIIPSRFTIEQHEDSNQYKVSLKDIFSGKINKAPY